MDPIIEQARKLAEMLAADPRFTKLRQLESDVLSDPEKRQAPRGLREEPAEPRAQAAGVPADHARREEGARRDHEEGPRGAGAARPRARAGGLRADDGPGEPDDPREAAGRDSQGGPVHSLVVADSRRTVADARRAGPVCIETRSLVEVSAGLTIRRPVLPAASCRATIAGITSRSARIETPRSPAVSSSSSAAWPWM